MKGLLNCRGCGAKYHPFTGHRCGWQADYLARLAEMRKHRTLWWLKGLK